MMRTLLFCLIFFATSTVLLAQGTETFDNICTSGCSPSTSSYASRSWLGQDGSTWTAELSRTSESIVGAAMCMNDDVSGAYVQSGTITGGIGSITISTQRKFSGGSGTLDVLVNGSSVGTVPYGTAIETTTISGINIDGSVVIRIDNNIGGSNSGGADRVAVDNIVWTPYSVPLPVTLTAFNAKLTNQGAMLEWTTASEENNDYFAVEMSRDATRFSESAKVSGNGTTESLETYTYEYKNLTAGTYYFRLRQVDFDGQSTYSDVVTLTVEGDRDFLMVNNAVQDIAVIDVTTPRAVRILNMAGAVVAEHDLQAGRNNLDVSDLANGMYILSDGNNAKRFVK